MVIIATCLPQAGEKYNCKSMIHNRKFIWRVVWFVYVLQMGCKPSSNQGNDDLDMGKWECHKLSSDEICLPNDWNRIDQDKAYFFAYLDNDNKLSYFAILRYDMLKNSINSEVYLKEMVNQLLSDDRELFEGYTLKELKFVDKVSYYGEYYTHIDNKLFFTYSMVIEYNWNLFEITLKVPRDQSENYKDIFKMILTNFRVGDKRLFKSGDEIIEENLIKLHE